MGGGGRTSAGSARPTDRPLAIHTSAGSAGPTDRLLAIQSAQNRDRPTDLQLGVRNTGRRLGKAEGAWLANRERLFQTHRTLSLIAGK